MSKTLHLALAACSVPLLLSGCSGSSPTQAAHSPTSGPSPSATSAALPVATSYVVTAGAGVTDKDLKDALTPIAKLPGVVGVSLTGNHQLRVDLTRDPLKDHGAALFAALRKLGSISVPST